MCRAGGRRCPACASPEGRAKHNDRRRRNREIRRNIIGWAEANDVPPGELTDLKAASPAAVKEWARAQGLDPDTFADTPTTSPAPQLPPLAGPCTPGDEKRAPTTRSPAGGGAAAAPGGTGPLVDELGWSIAGELDADGCSAEVRAWMAAIEAQQGDHPDEAALLDSAPAWSTDVPRSTNEIRRVQFARDDDTIGPVGYFKPIAGEDEATAQDYGHDTWRLGNQQCLHEAAAWMVAKRLGPPYSEIVAPTVIREVSGRRGAVSLAFEPSGEGGWSTAPPEHVTQNLPEQVPDWNRRMKATALFDAIVGAQDRHGDNWLASDSTADFRLIDHGFTFARLGDHLNWAIPQEDRHARGEAVLEAHERQLLARVKADPTTLGLVDVLAPARLEALRARVDWMLKHDRVLRNFGEAAGNPLP